MTKIVMASDHAGFKLKEHLKSYLEKKGYVIDDKGTHSEESCDYSDFGHPAAEAVEKGEAAWGIGVCSTGEGMTMTLNKHQGIRAALCWNTEVASFAKKHNNANFLVLPAKFLTNSEGEEILEVFMATEFEGGRHERRINKIPLNIAVEGEVFDNRPEL